VLPTGSRHFSRIKFHSLAEIYVGSARIPCEMLDISLKGVLVKAAVEAAVGTACTVCIPLSEEAVIRMVGQVRHHEGALVGVRCDEIDLESMTHLRRLIELNLGDEAQVNRELTALIP
jgi:hypothetical protein